MIIKNLGPVKDLQIYLNKETILLGKNNSGKTYVSYLIYGVFKKFDIIKKEVIGDFVKKKYKNHNTNYIIKINKEEISSFLLDSSLSQLNKKIIKDLPKIFNLPEESFTETKVKIEIDDIDFLTKNAQEKNINTQVRRFSLNPGILCSLEIQTNEKEWEFQLKNIEVRNFLSSEEEEEDIEISVEDINKFFIKILGDYLSNQIFSIPSIIYIPAERNGINVFRKELYKKRSTETFEIENEKELYTYPLPISDYMKYLNELDFETDEKLSEIFKVQSSIRDEVWSDFSENILRGKYEYESKTNEYYYRELFSVTKQGKLNYRKKRIPLKVASSSTKSLFGLEHYFKYKLKKGDILFIDEPEMNLDPENQMRIAELLIKLAHKGVKVIISTHSDYLTRATTNELLKSRIPSTAKSIKAFDEDVSGYYFDRSKISSMGNLTDITYISNFDDPNVKLEESYFKFKSLLEESLEE